VLLAQWPHVVVKSDDLHDPFDWLLLAEPGFK
jgi:hypothetical protein